MLALLPLALLLVVPPPRRPPSAPTVGPVVREAPAPWKVGTDELPLPLPPGVGLAGYGPLRRARGVRDSPMVRTVAIGGLAVVAIDVLEISPQLEAAITARFRRRFGEAPPPMLVAATHSHSGPGGTDANPVAEWLAEGRYEPALVDALADTVALAVRHAQADESPADISWSSVARSDLQEERDPGGRRDPTLFVLPAARAGT